MGYRIPFVSPAKSYMSIKPEIDEVFVDVLSKGDLVDREQLHRFEENLARFVGVRFAVGVNSGYDALHLSLRAAGIGPGDEVIVPSHTFAATASCVVNVGAVPVLVDIGPDFNIDPQKIEEAISERTKGIIPVHLNGYMADMEAVSDIAGRHGLTIVEDACQSLGARMSGINAGAWGLTGCWSFYPFKMLGGYGDGGAVTTNDEATALFIRRMRFNGEDRPTGEFTGHGFSCILDNLHAALLDVKLKKLPDWIDKRRRISEKYRKALSGVRALILPHYDDPRRDHVYQNYVVLSLHGDDFSNYLKDNGIEVLTQYRKPYYKHEALKLVDRGFPVTEMISGRVCSLPMNTELEDDEVDYIIQTILRFHGNRGG